MFEKLKVRNKLIKIAESHNKNKTVTLYDCNDGDPVSYWCYVEDLDVNNLEEFFPKNYLDNYIDIYKERSESIYIGIDLTIKDIEIKGE